MAAVLLIPALPYLGATPRTPLPCGLQGSTLALAVHFSEPGNPDYECSALNETVHQGLSLLGLSAAQLPSSVRCSDLGTNNRLLFLTFPQDNTASAIVVALQSLPDLASGLLLTLKVGVTV